MANTVITSSAATTGANEDHLVRRPVRANVSGLGRWANINKNSPKKRKQPHAAPAASKKKLSTKSTPTSLSSHPTPAATADSEDAPNKVLSDTAVEAPLKKKKKLNTGALGVLENGALTSLSCCYYCYLTCCLTSATAITQDVDTSLLDEEATDVEGLLEDLNHIVTSLPDAHPAKTHAPSADIKQFFNNVRTSDHKDSKGNLRRVHDCIICK